MTKLRKAFSKNFKKIRIAKGFTQEELAESLGINVRYIQQLEGRSTPNVKLDTLEALAKVLKVKPSDFLLWSLFIDDHSFPSCLVVFGHSFNLYIFNFGLPFGVIIQLVFKNPGENESGILGATVANSETYIAGGGPMLWGSDPVMVMAAAGQAKKQSVFS